MSGHSNKSQRPRAQRRYARKARPVGDKHERDAYWVPLPRPRDKCRPFGDEFEAPRIS